MIGQTNIDYNFINVEDKKEEIFSLLEKYRGELHIMVNRLPKELSFSPKLKCSNTYFFATW